MPAKNGVEFYAEGVFEESTFFPNGIKCCDPCKHKRFKITNGNLRIICIKTFESLNLIDIYSDRGVDCPLKFRGEKNE